MPYVNVKITKGDVSNSQKQALVRDITTSLVNHLGKKPEHIHIVIDEIDPENWGFCGELTTEYRSNQKEPAAAPPFSLEYVLPRILKSSPKKLVALRHFISTMYQFDAKITEKDIDELITKLQKQKHLSIDSTGKVTYKTL